MAEAPGQSQIFVDDDDLLGGPAERVRPALQVVLAGGTLPMVVHLLQRGLPHIEVRLPPQMLTRHFAPGGHPDRSLAPEAAHASTMPASSVVSSDRAGGSIVRGGRASAGRRGRRDGRGQRRHRGKPRRHAAGEKQRQAMAARAERP